MALFFLDLRTWQQLAPAWTGLPTASLACFWQAILQIDESDAIFFIVYMWQQLAPARLGLPHCGPGVLLAGSLCSYA